MFRLTPFLLALFLTLGIFNAALAQEVDAPADSVVVEEEEPTDLMRAQALMVVLSTELDGLAKIIPQAKKTENEALQLLRVSALRHIEVMDDTEPDLLKILPKLDPEDPATEEVKLSVANYYIEKYDINEASIEFWVREIDHLREQRHTTPAEEMGDLETSISQARERLDSMLPILSGTISTAESLGVDVGQSWERFDRAVNTRAENLVGRLQISVDARDNFRKKLDTSTKAGASEAEITTDRTNLQYAEMRVQGVAKSLGSTVDVLGSRGFPTAPYRQFIIKTTGEISDKVLDPRVLWGLLKDGLKSLGQWLQDNGPTALVKLVIVIVIILFFRLVFRISWWLMRAVRMVKLTKLMVQLGNSMVGPLATIFGIFAGLWFIGANPTTLLTGAGVAGVVIGFALQDSLSNMAAGFFILATRPFDVDDTIRTGTVVGTVKAMWIANTTVVTFDGRRLLIPNRKIWADIIENRSVEPLRRTDITVRVGYDEDIDRVIAILLELVRSEGRVLDHPEPVVFVSGWADSWAEIAVRPWTRNEDWWSLLKDLPRLVVNRFAEEGIEIPHPRMEMAGLPGPQPPHQQPGE